jgi:hypothetical protein
LGSELRFALAQNEGRPCGRPSGIPGLDFPGRCRENVSRRGNGVRIRLPHGFLAELFAHVFDEGLELGAVLPRGQALGQGVDVESALAGAGALLADGMRQELAEGDDLLHGRVEGDGIGVFRFAAW